MRDYQYDPQTLIYTLRDEHGTYQMKAERLWRNPGVLERYGIALPQRKLTVWQKIMNFLKGV